MEKEAKYAGADNSTPSVPQYFSWINSTNEGSTEAQTITNLDYFQYMRDTYGMQIKLYAWDAGNFDGAAEGFGNVDSEKFRSQYPEGYKNVVKKAEEGGVRMGLWGSPDGFGDDPETEKKRYEFFVHLCRDYHFGQFKLDGVCGFLRPEKAELFAKMLQECRQYSPDLIVLNHRLPLYEAERYVTTYLWQGAESYTDVCCTPPRNTALHNRSYMFVRGHVDNLERLVEDHGVCISSSIDYFEDELVYQAFSRSLILAPETYGNPWLMKDSEQARYARIYTLHARNAAILVNGLRLGEEYGNYAISRGVEDKRFICTGNNSWRTKKVTFKVDESIGLTKNGKYKVILRHPYDEELAILDYGESFDYDILPFRAALIEVATVETAGPVISGIAYQVIKEDKDGNPIEYKVVRDDKIDIREKAPVLLASAGTINDDMENDEFMYETAMFAISNDSLEYQSLLRAGDTSVPQIQAARDAFFDQTTYKLRGCENRNLFDGNEETIFDGQSRCYCDQDLRIKGGCLRVDFGKEIDADRIEIVSFKPNEPTREVLEMLTPEIATYSTDLKNWKDSEKAVFEEVCDYTQQVARFTVHTLYDCEGKKIKSIYKVASPLRYFRLPCPMDRIYTLKAFKGDKEIELDNPFANNMQADYKKNVSKFQKSAEFTLPEYKDGAYLAVAVEGFHGVEGVYSVIEADGKCYGSNRRSSAYQANNWEHRIMMTEYYNTLYFDLPQGLAGKKVKLTTLFNWIDDAAIPVNIYLCDKHI